MVQIDNEPNALANAPDLQLYRGCPIVKPSARLSVGLSVKLRGVLLYPPQYLFFAPGNLGSHAPHQAK
jgi:hypothetical protein